MTPWKRLKRLTRKYTARRDAPHQESRRKTMIAAGDAARDRGDWPDAAALYSSALSIRPRDRGLLIQYGHALKESGRTAEAEGAYQAAIQADPADPDAWMQLGHVRKLQQRVAEALDCYAEALRRDPNCRGAREELLAAGARHRLTMANYGQTATTSILAQIGDTLRRNLQAIDEMLVVSTFPVEAYDAFRKTYPIQPPPEVATAACAPLALRIDAHAGSPAKLRRTLNSLLDQRDPEWQAYVFASPEMRQQTVADIVERDARIIFVSNPSPDGEPDICEQAVLSLTSGTVLNREAVGWFRFASHRAPNAAIYSDHDHYLTHWRTGLTHLAPALQPAPDRYELATSPAPPALVLLPGAVARRLISDRAISALEALTFAYQTSRSVMHIPRILASVPADDTGITRSNMAAASPDPHSPMSAARILVIIPTRDQVDILKACIQSLIQNANNVDILSIIVVDNNSTLPETITYLRESENSGHITLISSETPFNWSRLNNIGSDTSKFGDILVFANNDIEMRTPGWDDQIRSSLSNADVGALGARLLYPDGTLQHSGIAFGNEDNRPHHEGVGSPGNVDGPLNRWRRQRQAAAVTGAFMAVRREVFVAAGGFNEKLAVGYNDIDFCFRVRQMGLSILFDPCIEAVHHESKTRGLNDNPEKIEWDDAELEDLFMIWGEALFRDPSINPQWVCTQFRSFDGFRDLSVRQVIDWINYSANPAPTPRLAP